jgi:hypothetical protein
MHFAIVIGAERVRRFGAWNLDDFFPVCGWTDKRNSFCFYRSGPFIPATFFANGKE